MGGLGEVKKATTRLPIPERGSVGLQSCPVKTGACVSTGISDKQRKGRAAVD